MLMDTHMGKFPLSLNCPLPTLAAASVRTLLSPLLPQSPPCQQTKAPILMKKASGSTDQVARERPLLAMNQSIRMASVSEFGQSAGGIRHHLPPHNSANRPTHQMRGVIQKLLATGINMNKKKPGK
jgi:hypothetical protein